MKGYRMIEAVQIFYHRNLVGLPGPAGTAKLDYILEDHSFGACEPNLSNLYLRDLILIPKSCAAFCFDPRAISIALII